MAWTQARQGELLLTVTGALPEGCTQAGLTGDLLVVGHSETGHFHAFKKDSGVELWETQNPHICYLRTTDIPAELDHFRVDFQHGSIALKPHTVYEVRRQLQFLHEHAPVVWVD